MGLPNVLDTGRSGLMASKAAISTGGHNISNANTEGFTRQRVRTQSAADAGVIGKHQIGRGTNVAGVERINDRYVEKQIRTSGRDMAYYEEKDVGYTYLEDIFNEMGGEGLNRLVSRFFNDFRKLSNEPDNEAVRQSVRESAQAVVNDFRRIRGSVEDVRNMMDSRVENYVHEMNSLAEEVKNLNIRIRSIDIGGGSPNDLLDKRDQALKKLGTFLDLNMHQDGDGNYVVDITNMGPLVVGPNVEKFSTYRSPRDENGKATNSLDIRSSLNSGATATHRLRGGKLGSLVDMRDQTVNAVVDRLDQLAYGIASAVNSIHSQGFTRDGRTGVQFFKQPLGVERAAELIDLSQDLKDDPNSIATAAEPESPGDNRIALALGSIQHEGILNDGRTTFDDYYNSIVSSVGVASARNKSSLNQQKDIITQMNKIRDQVSGVSIDEETANIMQYHQLYGASARVIQIADDMLKTVLSLGT